MTLHPITNYSEEDREEFLGRCKLLQRKWQVGDLIWRLNEVEMITKVVGSSLVLLDFKANELAHFYEVAIESWLPLEGDLMDIEKFGASEIEKAIEGQGEGLGAIYGRGLLSASTAPRLLAMLRAIQNCGEMCPRRKSEGNPDAVVDLFCGRQCSGIHKHNSDEPHLCLDCWRKK